MRTIKNSIGSLAIIGGLIASLNLGHAQTTAKAVQSVSLLNELDQPQTQTRAVSLATLDFDGNSGGDDSPTYSFPMNGLWLELTGISNELVYLNLHNATDEVYEVWSKIDLLAPSWNIEQEVWPGTNQAVVPFTVPQLDRANLFIWARDWTGVDENSNGIPDWWEFKYFGYVGVDPNSAPNGNGQSLLYDYQNGFDPTDYYNGNLPNITIISGNNQRGLPGVFLPEGLTVQLADTNGVPLINAPVTFAVTNVDGLFATFSGGTTSSSFQLRTDTNGEASAWLQLPATSGTNFVTVSAQSGTNTALTNFTEIAGILPMIPMMAIGGERIMELTTNGDVISWGGNQYGELGDYTHLDSDVPVHVVGLTNIIKIASGMNHSLAIDANGALWAWGDNQLAQLGDGDLNATNLPVQVSGMTNSVMAVAGGSGSSWGNYVISVAVKADGTVWTWGSKYENSDEIHNVIPTQVEGLTNVIAVAAGQQHFLALSIDGTVWACGSDNFGQLGDGMAGSSDTPVQVSGLSNIVAICAGDNHSLALDTNGCVWAWGLNESGQLGDGGTEAANGLPVLVFSNAVQIAAGANHSLALDNESNVWAWGNDGSGQLGDGGPNNNGGQYNTNLPMQVLELTNIIAIAAGSDASAALDVDGNWWQWGASDGDIMTDPAWGDENGLPALAPQYVDFYNGQLPNLTILNGNNQISHAGLEFEQSLVFQVTDTNGVALSNAPVSVEVIAGDMELRTVSGGDNYKGLRLTTDTNGEVSLIGYADQDFSNPNCFVRVLAASRERIVEADFNETLIPPPTISIASPADGSTIILGTNQALTITVDAETAPGASIQEVDYYYGTNGTADTLLGVSTQSPYSFIWTNSLWWTNAFVGQYTLSAVAMDNMGGQSGPQSVTVTIALDSDGIGIPDYWQLQYFGYVGVDPNSSPDGNGQSLLYDYQNGFDPTDYYDGNPPNIQIVSVDNLVETNQLGLAGSFLPVPLTALITDANAMPLTYAPVAFTAALGNIQLAITTNNAPATNLTLRTDSNGLALVWIYFPPEACFINNTVAVQAGSTITNVIIASDLDGNGLPDYWEIEYFSTNGLDPNSSPDGNGQSLLYDYQNGIDPTDYYNGNLPNLEIVSGNNQGGNYDSFLPLPVIIKAANTDFGALSNAPIVFTVTNGTAQLASTTNDTPSSTLALRTDSNGLASVWVYFPPANSNSPDSTILVSAFSGTNSASIIVNEYVPLGHWTFNDTNTWIGEEGQLPSLANNVVGIPDWSSNAVLVDSSSPALISYNVVEPNGHTNISQTGSVLFWFRPDWNSGSGPGASARLIEVSSSNPAFINESWSLTVEYDGTMLFFGHALDPGISWHSNEWYQIALTYSTTSSALYVDGQLLLQLPNVFSIPADAYGPTNGFRIIIGSDQNGNNQAGGAFDELKTFDYPLDANHIVTCSSEIPDWWEVKYFNQTGLDPNSSPDGHGQSLLYDYQYGFDPTDYYDGNPPNIQIVSVDNLVETNQLGLAGSFLPVPLTALITDANAMPLTNAPVAFTAALGNIQLAITTNNAPATNLTLRTDSNGLASVWIYFPPEAYFINNTVAVQAGSTITNVIIASDLDGNGLPDYWEIEYFSTNGLDPNSSPDGNGQTLLYDYQNGIDPTDYYNGNLPNLEIVSGNNQGGNYDSFLPFPVIIGVTDVYSDVLTNAPVTFTVTNGTALLAATTNDTPVASLALRTDTSGQASVWVYFPPASSNPPDSTIVVNASSGVNSTAVTVNEYVLLGHWTFNDTNTWIGEGGQLPLVATNVVGVPDWSSNAVLVGISTASLAYRVVETNDSLNINCQTGSVLFYFKPDWSSADEYQDGTGPGTSGRLIEMGSYNPAFTNGWWSLYLSPDGTQLLFGTSTNGGGMTNLSATISWASNTWYQIALTYSPTASSLYVDGQLLANGAGVTDYPNADELTDGFRIGSDQDGNNQAAGAFDELETFASPLSSISSPIDTYWFGIPDYKADPNGTLAAWQMLYFGHMGLDPDSDPYGIGYTLLYDYQNGIYPNTISFSFTAPNQYVTTNVVGGIITILGGVPSNIAVLVDSTNFAGATWSAYGSSNITVNLGSTDGSHDVWIGLRGLPANAQQTWVETTLVLDSVLPTITITNPVDGVSLNASRVNVCGNFTAASLKQITVNDITAFVNGTNFEALNVPLAAGPNTITAVVEDLTGETNSTSISITGLTNADGSMNNPVQLQATPVAGFAPLRVTFQIQANVPGTIQQVLYDFNGDGIADFVTNSLDSIAYTYQTNGEYFPVVTIQTDAGRFSSVGGWNSASLDPSNQPIRINVQTPATQSTLASIADPVDIKWDGTHLYALSGSGAAIYEFATNGATIRSLGGIGTNPSGIDVDAAGSVYVAVTGSNQVRKLNPTDVSFQADANFGIGGCIGLTNGASGTTNSEFNAPFDVAVSPDGGTISVSDSGNNRIQQFSATNGAFLASYGLQGSDIGQFNAPKGLTYDSAGNLYIVDSGNNRIVLVQETSVEEATGTYGTALGQFSGPVNISVGDRGVYVADAGNNRIQSFIPGIPFDASSSSIRFAVTNFNQPAAVAAIETLTNEMFYVADTGNNRVILCNAPNNNLDTIQAVWNNMTSHVASGDINGALSFFSIASQDDYRQAFLSVGTGNTTSAISQIGTLTPSYIDDASAEYYFTETMDGQIITFPVEFDFENGVWKIVEF